jgi:type IV pilus assembly protein PilM
MNFANIGKIKFVNTLVNQFQTLTSGSEKPLIGIDIGSYAIKIVQFSGSGNRLKLKNWAYKPYSFAHDAQASEKKVAITQTLLELVKKLDIGGKSCAISVSGNSVIIRYVAIAKTNRQDIKKILSAQAEPFIPFDIRDVNLDCHILGDTKQSKQIKTEIILIAAKKDLIKSKLDLVNSTKLKPVIVDIDAFALENLCQKLKITGDESGVMVLNIGHKLTNLTIIEKSLTRVVRDVVISGQTFTKSVAKACEVDYERAEELKKLFGIASQKASAANLEHPSQEAEQSPAGPEIEKNASAHKGNTAPMPEKKEDNVNQPQVHPEEEKYREKIAEALKQNLKDLSVEIKRSLDFYYSQGKDRSISKVYLTGGSSAMGGIEKFLESQLNMPVEVLNPCTFAETKNTPEINKSIVPALSIACGLSIRKLWDWA